VDACPDYPAGREPGTDVIVVSVTEAGLEPYLNKQGCIDHYDAGYAMVRFHDEPERLVPVPPEALDPI